ncbi:MAG TPA: hypothetical protein VEH29_18480 [Acidimicrobiales bacterium]|nr:hypothetical protein [Acidimicrobiales bacterium]
MSHATEAFEAAFSKADELSGAAFNEAAQPDADASAEFEGVPTPAAQTS